MSTTVLATEHRLINGQQVLVEKRRVGKSTAWYMLCRDRTGKLRYHYLGKTLPSVFDLEPHQTTCQQCGTPLPPQKTGAHQVFCSDTCRTNSYYRETTRSNKSSISFYKGQR